MAERKPGAVAEIGSETGAIIRYAISADGTPIAYQESGAGPVLVLVHGSGDSRTRWSAVAPELSRCFKVCAMDRRGHGQSGDSPAYSLQREIEDIEAVLLKTGGHASLLAHSFGGICALEAARRTGVEKLILYEPPIPLPGESFRGEYLERIDALLARGELEAIWVSFLKDIIGMSEREIAQYRTSPSWGSRVEMARVLPREARARNAYRFDASRFTDFLTPTLLLAGSASGPELGADVDMLRSALPVCRVSIFEGEGHVAMSSAPSLFLREVIAFLS